MDLLGDILDTFKLSASVFLHANFCGAWAVDSSGEQKATFHMVARGACWLHLPGEGVPIGLRAGDLVVFPHDALHTIANSEVPPAPEFPRNQASENSADGPATSLICGYFQFESHNWNPLLNALPEVMLIRGEESANTALMDTLIRFIIYETESNSPGGSVVIDKMSEVLFIHVVRTYIHNEDISDGYIAALADKQVCTAITEIHQQPGASWTVESLAEKAGMSRSAFATRFHRMVKMTPMQYVTCWRMQRAFEQFKTTKQSVTQVAENYGYRSEASFSKAFKKHFGYGPGAVRKK